MPEENRRSRARTIQAIGALSSVGIAFVLAVLIGFLVGYGLDSWLGTSPLLTLVFFFVGVAAGVLNVVRAASAFSGDRRR